MSDLVPEEAVQKAIALVEQVDRVRINCQKQLENLDELEYGLLKKILWESRGDKVPEGATFKLSVEDIGDKGGRRYGYLTLTVNNSLRRRWPVWMHMAYGEFTLTDAWGDNPLIDRLCAILLKRQGTTESYVRRKRLAGINTGGYLPRAPELPFVEETKTATGWEV
jgi:hypothetical protein